MLISSRVRDSGDHGIPGNLQLRPPLEILSYRRRQLQVHKEVPLKDKMFLVVPIVEESTREIVGDCLVLAWVVDPWSTKYESVLGHVPSQHPKLGAMFHQYRKAA